nr:immunoglobulin heavy chain junction region [Macaca mulatta]
CARSRMAAGDAYDWFFDIW